MNKLLLCGAGLGLVSVIAGAWGDHTLSLDPDSAASLETAIRYNMLYAVLVTVLSLAPAEIKTRVPAFIFAIGTALFSFSIYAAVVTGLGMLTYITPVGGLTIMLGWAVLIRAAFLAKS